jgi:hypothetical protein
VHYHSFISSWRRPTVIEAEFFNGALKDEKPFQFEGLANVAIRAAQIWSNGVNASHGEVSAAAFEALALACAKV